MASQVEKFGKYILLEKLAAGGMAEVYLAKSEGAEGVNKFLAIKRILPDYSTNKEFIEMFIEEAKINVNLHHSNIVSIYEFGFEKNQFFIAMEYVEGYNLRQILNHMKKTTTTFSIDQSVFMVKEVAAGLDHAHRCIERGTGKPLNIIHRDISPQNMMVSFEGEVKIIDFGIAKASNQNEETRTGTLKGKYGYMSPEQAEGNVVDSRTDVFSLGIVLWELLANARLFTSDSEAGVLRKIRDCQITNIRKLNPNVPIELERIVHRALAKDKAQRYTKASEFHKDLNRFLNTHYPEFSQHEFSLFVKSLYGSSFLEKRKKLVEFSSVQPPATPENANPIAVTASGDGVASQKASAHTPKLPTAAPTEANVQNISQSAQAQVKTETHTSDFNANKTNPTATASHTSSQTLTLSKSAISLKTPNPHSRPRKPGETVTGIQVMKKRATWTERIINTSLTVTVAIALFSGGVILYKNKSTRTTESASMSSNVEIESTPSQNTIQENKYVVTISSDPAGADIFISDAPTGHTTPSQEEFTPGSVVKISLKKDNFVTYETTLVVDKNPMSLTATLQQNISMAFVTVDVPNGGSAPILEINGKRLTEKLPLLDYAVPANADITIKAHNPFTGLNAEKVVRLRLNEHQKVQLILK